MSLILCNKKYVYVAIHVVVESKKMMIIKEGKIETLHTIEEKTMQFR